MLHLALLASLLPQAPGAPAPKDLTIDAATRSQVMDNTLELLGKQYVFPDVAKAMAVALRERRERKEYDAITSALAFADKLTADLQAVSHDKHLRVRYREQVLPPDEVDDGKGPTPEEVETFRREAARDNFAFKRVERLDGNVGYVDFRGFLPTAIGAERVSAAMAFVADCDALIFDMRKNGGGSPEMVAFVCSYLFGAEPVHLNDIYYRPNDSTRQFWTDPGVPGRKFRGDVYVLTSNRTFSGAEEFTYDLQTQKRATIVGETTGGGANPGGMNRVHDHFGVFVPTGRAINPITHTNWEGTGVAPDVAVAAEQALTKAHMLALQKLLTASGDADLQTERKATLSRLEGELAAPKK
jgi:hypothetical protein